MAWGRGFRDAARDLFGGGRTSSSGARSRPSNFGTSAGRAGRNYGSGVGAEIGAYLAGKVGYGIAGPAGAFVLGGIGEKVGAIFGGNVGGAIGAGGRSFGTASYDSGSRDGRDLLNLGRATYNYFKKPRSSLAFSNLSGVGSAFNSSDVTTRSTIDYAALRDAAIRGGFSPLAVLRAGGSSGFVSTRVSSLGRIAAPASQSYSQPRKQTYSDYLQSRDVSNFNRRRDDLELGILEQQFQNASNKTSVFGTKITNNKFPQFDKYGQPIISVGAKYFVVVDGKRLFFQGHNPEAFESSFDELRGSGVLLTAEAGIEYGRYISDLMGERGVTVDPKTALVLWKHYTKGTGVPKKSSPIPKLRPQVRYGPDPYQGNMFYKRKGN